MENTTRVYVGGLPRDVLSREVEDSFRRYGALTNVWIARNPPGFAFLDYEDPRDADDAIREMDGRDFLGGRIRVELAKGGRRKERGSKRDHDDRRDRRDYDRRDDRRDDRRGRDYDRRDDRRDYDRRDDRRDGRRSKGNGFKVELSGFPSSEDWKDVKDFLRTGGEVNFANIKEDGCGLAEFCSEEDMQNAISKLDGTEYKGEKISIRAQDGGSRGGDGGNNYASSSRRSRSRSRSASPKKEERRSRSRSRSASPRDRKPSRSRSNSRSKSPSRRSPPPRKNSI